MVTIIKLNLVLLALSIVSSKIANNRIQLTVKSVTFFAKQKNAPLFTSADAGVIFKNSGASIINSIIGKTILSIARGDMLIDGMENEDDHGPLEFQFTDGTVLTLELISDGESVKYTITKRLPSKLIGQGSEWNRIVITDSNPFLRAIGSKIAETDNLLFSANGSNSTISGYGIKLKNKNFIIYYNAGDFAKIYWNSLPPKLSQPFMLWWENEKFKKI